ncbi:hypothetical protein BC936DRAFT_143133, partial [Jimgerdemannia flammicorona]
STQRSLTTPFPNRPSSSSSQLLRTWSVAGTWKFQRDATYTTKVSPELSVCDCSSFGYGFLRNVPQSNSALSLARRRVIFARRMRSIMSLVSGCYALGIDMTARNLQAEAKKKGLPWSMAKGFDTFTPISWRDASRRRALGDGSGVFRYESRIFYLILRCMFARLVRSYSDFIPKNDIPDPSDVNLWLKLDNVLKQQGNTSDMIFNIPTLLEFVTSIMRLEPGDLLMTGTPAGVGPIQPGQTITAGLKVGSSETDLMQVRFGIVERRGEARL